MLFTEEGYTICEANTFPGFKGLEQASHVNIPQKIFAAMRRNMNAEYGEIIPAEEDELQAFLGN